MAWPHMDPCVGMGRPSDRQTSHHPTNASSQLHSSAPSAEVTAGTATYSIQCLSLSPPSFKYIFKVVITQKTAEVVKNKAQSHQKQPSAFRFSIVLPQQTFCFPNSISLNYPRVK